ncbi:MAG: hypothetical protein IH881_04110 [Myxococcales bacterium]|nr:hypothetical protein [Myxococcales bacterium]
MASKPIRANCWRYKTSDAPAIPALDTPAHERGGVLEFSGDALHFNDWHVPFREVTSAELTEAVAGLGILRIRTLEEVLDFAVRVKQVPTEIGVAVKRKAPTPAMGKAYSRGQLIGAAVVLAALFLISLMFR